MSEAMVSSLHYYPIKACAAVDATEVSFTEFGIRHDREWMLIDEDGELLSQRNHPELALVKTTVTDTSLTAEAPGQGQLTIHLANENLRGAEEIPVNVFKKSGSGLYQGAIAAHYFSDYLHESARLIRIKQPREIKPECRVPGASERTAFADGFPILLASQASLTELNTNLEEPIPMNRFRPNIVVSGENLPAYDEDYWRELRIGRLRAYVVRACARCPVPNVDQQTGILPRDRLVTKALRKTRRGIDPLNEKTEIFFAQNLTHVFKTGPSVKVGATVSVIERSGERNLRPIINA